MFLRLSHRFTRIDKTNSARYFCLRLVISGQWVVFQGWKTPWTHCFLTQWTFNTMPACAIVCLSMGTASRFGQQRLRDFGVKHQSNTIASPAHSFPLEQLGHLTVVLQLRRSLSRGRAAGNGSQMHSFRKMFTMLCKTMQCIFQNTMACMINVW